MLKVLLMTGVVTLALTGCASMSSSDKTYASAEEAVNVLLEAGLPCELPVWKTRADSSGVESDTAECSDNNGDSYYVHVFASESSAREWLRYWCAESSDIEMVSDLFGKNWSTEGTYDDVSLGDLSKALGGDISTYGKQCAAVQ